VYPLIIIFVLQIQLQLKPDYENELFKNSIGSITKLPIVYRQPSFGTGYDAKAKNDFGGQGKDADCDYAKKFES